MPVTNITTVSFYEEFIKSNTKCVIHFYAPWADQCRQVNDVIDSLSELDTYKSIQFGKIVAEDLPEVSLKCFITAVPTVILFEKEKNIARIDGASPTELVDKIKKYLVQKTSDNANIKNEAADSEDLNNRLHKLINQAPCILFMKGDSEAPKCGFSKRIVEILDKNDLKYETFDILQDNEVREGLKKYSNWPTYPQLYINGELIGGLDIVSEMYESGELKSILPIKKEENIDFKLQSLINQAPCMLFMKGSRDVPRCGFSKTIISLLNDHKADYQTFDILEDNQVREALKVYSNWPTYPQLYINGELIGGLDIVKEMDESGELNSVLPKVKE